MRIHVRTAAIFLSIFCLTAAAPALAQQQERQAAANQQLLSGDLLKVDNVAKTITVKGADGVETVVAYNDATIVTGAADIAGLATITAPKVEVTYTEDATTKAKTATTIAVQRPAFAPAPANPPAPPAPPAPSATIVAAPLSMAGDLIIVDATDKKITVRGVDKVETIFIYTDASAITGAPDWAGLSSMTNQKVMITYTEDPVTKAKTITRIIVTPR